MYRSLSIKASRTLQAAVVVTLASCVPTFADTFTWTPTAASTSLNWNNTSQNNWGTGVGGDFPDIAGDVANLNNDIVGNQALRLGAPITVGILNLGDASGGHTFTINNNSTAGVATSTNTLTFQTAAAGGVAQLNIEAAGSVTNTISANMLVGGTSSLAINALGGQLLSQSGTFTVGSANSVTLTGGVNETNTWAMGGDLAGSGTVIYNGLGGSSVSGAKSFTGTFVLNRGVSGPSNAGSLTVTNGSIANSAEVVINGFLSGSSSSSSIIQAGGSLHTGNGTSVLTNPGQRITQNVITLNGGTLTAQGQPATVALANDWQKGLEYHSETLSTLSFNSGGSVLSSGAGSNTLGYQLTVGTLARGAGATAFVRSTTLGGTTQISASNGTTFLKGAGGLNNTSTMSIIPWMVADGGGSSTSSPNAFATIDTATGLIRELTAAESPTAVGTGTTSNVAPSVLTMASDTTVNSIRFTATGSQLIASAQSGVGVAKTLNVTSGGVFMSGAGGALGTVGATNAGTLNFGTAEGVVWSINVNTNAIGAAITGSGGFTKAGTGTLTLAGNNSGLSGDVNVSGGALRIGDGGSNPSALGSGDVTVHNGASLQISSTNAIADTATLTLDAFGLFNGKIILDAGINEVVGSLLLGTLLQPGTTYGSTSSAALVKNDTYFGGTGILTVSSVVVPEPASFGMAMFGMLALAGRRRR